MDWKYLTAIALTIIFGILAIIKTRRYRGQLYLYTESVINVVETFSFSGLTVHYNDMPVESDVALYRGVLVNTGYCDITKSMIHIPPQIIIPSEYRWYSASVVKCSPNVDASITITDNTLTILYDLMRMEEYITFEALVGCPRIAIEGKRSIHAATRLRNNITINDRIENTGRTKIQDIPQAPYISTEYGYGTVAVFMVTMLLLLTIITDDFGNNMTIMSIVSFILIAPVLLLMYRDSRHASRIKKIIGG